MGRVPTPEELEFLASGAVRSRDVPGPLPSNLPRAQAQALAALYAEEEVRNPGAPPEVIAARTHARFVQEFGAVPLPTTPEIGLVHAASLALGPHVNAPGGEDRSLIDRIALSQFGVPTSGSYDDLTKASEQRMAEMAAREKELGHAVLQPMRDVYGELAGVAAHPSPQNIASAGVDVAQFPGREMLATAGGFLGVLGQTLDRPVVGPGLDTYRAETAPGTALRVAGGLAAPAIEAAATAARGHSINDIAGGWTVPAEVAARGGQAIAAGMLSEAGVPPEAIAKGVARNPLDFLERPLLDPEIEAGRRPGGMTWRAPPRADPLAQAFADYNRRWLQGIYEGRGFTSTMQDIAVSQGHAAPGDEGAPWYGSPGYAAASVGGMINEFQPWELPIIGAVERGAGAYHAARGFSDIAPKGMEAGAALAGVSAGVRDDHVSGVLPLASYHAGRVARHESVLDSLPEPVRAVVDRLLRDRTGLNLATFDARNLAGEAGPPPVPTFVVPPEGGPLYEPGVGYRPKPPPPGPPPARQGPMTPVGRFAYGDTDYHPLATAQPSPPAITTPVEYTPTAAGKVPGAPPANLAETVPPIPPEPSPRVISGFLGGYYLAPDSMPAPTDPEWASVSLQAENVPPPVSDHGATLEQLARQAEEVGAPPEWVDHLVSKVEAGKVEEADALKLLHARVEGTLPPAHPAAQPRAGDVRMAQQRAPWEQTILQGVAEAEARQRAAWAANEAAGGQDPAKLQAWVEASAALHRAQVRRGEELTRSERNAGAWGLTPTRYDPVRGVVRSEVPIVEPGAGGGPPIPEARPRVPAEAVNVETAPSGRLTPSVPTPGKVGPRPRPVLSLLERFKRALKARGESPHAAIREVYGPDAPIQGRLAEGWLASERGWQHQMANDPAIRVMEPDLPDVVGKKYYVHSPSPDGQAPRLVSGDQLVSLPEALRRLIRRKNVEEEVRVAGSGRPVAGWNRDSEAVGLGGAHLSGASANETTLVGEVLGGIQIPEAKLRAQLKRGEPSYFGPPVGLVTNWAQKQYDALVAPGLTRDLPTMSALNPTQRTLVWAIDEAHRLLARGLVGDDRLVKLGGVGPDASWVSPREAEIVTAKMQGIYKAFDLDPEAIFRRGADVSGTLRLTPEEIDRFEHMAGQNGIPFRRTAPDTRTQWWEEPDLRSGVPVTVKEWREVNDALVNELAGVSARGIYQHRAIARFADNVADAVHNVAMHDPETVAQHGYQMAGALMSSILRLPESQLPQDKRLVLDGIRTYLSSNGDELMREYRKIAGAAAAGLTWSEWGKRLVGLRQPLRPRDILAQVLHEHWKPIVPGEWELLYRDIPTPRNTAIPAAGPSMVGPLKGAARTTGAAPAPGMAVRGARDPWAPMFRFRDEVLRHSAGYVESRDRLLKSSIPEEVHKGLVAWRSRRLAQADHYARMWVQAHVPGYNGEIVDTLLRKEATATGASVATVLHDVYYRTFILGQHTYVKKLFESLNQATAPDLRAELGFALRVRADSRITEAARRLRAAGLGLDKDSAVASMVEAILRGDSEFHEPVPGQPGKYRVATLISNSTDYDAAVEFLARNGLKPVAHGFGLEQVGQFEDVVLAAPMFAQEVQRMAGYGVVNSARPLGPKAGIVANLGAGMLDYLSRIFKTGATTQFFIPSTAHVLANVVGAFPMLYARLGGERAASALGTWMRHPIFNTELVSRLSSYSGSSFLGGRLRLGNPLRDGALIKSRGGGFYSVAEAERYAAEAGLQRTITRAELAEEMESELMREEQGFMRWALRKVPSPTGVGYATIGMGADWQKMLVEIDHATELMFRVGVFTDSLEHGEAPDYAARLAREALYDTSKLSEFERTVIRAFIPFYAFGRANVDANLKMALLHPERAALLLRLQGQQGDVWGFSHDEQMGMKPQDAVKAVLYRRGVAEALGDAAGLPPPLSAPMTGSPPYATSVRRPDDRLDERYSGVVYLTPPVPNPDGLMEIYHLLHLAGTLPRALTGAEIPLPGEPTDAESMQRQVQEVSPLVNLAAIAMTGVDPATKKLIDSYGDDEMPAYLFEVPLLAPVAQHLFHAGKVYIPNGKNADYAAGIDETGTAYTWAAGAEPGATEAQRTDGQRLWRVYRAILGRPVTDTANRWAKVLNYGRPDWETQADAWAEALGGITARPVPSGVYSVAAARAAEQQALGGLKAEEAPLVPQLKESR